MYEENLQILSVQETNEEKYKQFLVVNDLLRDTVYENLLVNELSENELQHHLVYDKKMQQRHDSLFVLCVEIF